MKQNSHGKGKKNTHRSKKKKEPNTSKGSPEFLKVKKEKKVVEKKNE